jgi:hypothetical protein
MRKFLATAQVDLPMGFWAYQRRARSTPGNFSVPLRDVSQRRRSELVKTEPLERDRVGFVKAERLQVGQRRER